jgi:uncharacterized membrane protein
MNLTSLVKMPSQDRRHLWLLGLLVLLAFAEMVWLSLTQFEGFNMKYFDLGAMSQAVWSVTEGQALIFTGQGLPLSRLARNLEFFYFLLAPLYALFPSPKSLLIFQAGLYAAGGLPLFRLAHRRFGQVGTALIPVAIYLFYPVAQTAVLFEIHGDTLAMPWLLFALEALDRRAWRSFALWTVLALSCKFYVAVPVAVLGGLLWWQGERRAGLVTAAGGLLWGGLAFFVILPLFAPAGPEAEQARATAATYLGSRFADLDLAATGVLRLVNLVIVTMPAVIVLGWRAPLWLLPAASIIFPALLSSDLGPSFSYRTHHYAVAVPFLLAAIIYGADRVRQQWLQAATPAEQRRHPWRGRLFLTLLVTLIFNIGFVDTPFSPQYYLAAEGSGQGRDYNRYGRLPRDAFRERWLEANVPPDVPLLADELSATRLTNREILYLTQHPETTAIENLVDQVDYVVTDALFDFAVGNPLDPTQVYDGGARHEHRAINILLADPGFVLLEGRDGLLLFGRRGDGLQQEAELLAAGDGPFLASFDGMIGLLSATIEQVGPGLYRMVADWLALRPLDDQPPLFAVSRLSGVEHSRMVHLPSLVLRPVNDWPLDQRVRERFEFTIPEDLPAGEYPLLLGWYQGNHLLASQTDGRSRIGQEVQIGVLVVP